MKKKFGEFTATPAAEVTEWYNAHNALCKGDGISIYDLRMGGIIMKEIMTPDTPYVDPATIEAWMPMCTEFMKKFKEMSPLVQGKLMACMMQMQDPTSEMYKTMMTAGKEMFK